MYFVQRKSRCHIQYKVILLTLLDICKEDISSDDISSVLYLRNKILHDNASIPDFEIDLALRTENRIISKLKGKILVGTDNLKWFYEDIISQ